MQIQLTKNTSIDAFLLCVFIGIALGCLGVYVIASNAIEVENQAFADIEQMGCGELKEFIADKGWNEYGARWVTIEEHAKHTYTWTCEN